VGVDGAVVGGAGAGSAASAAKLLATSITPRQIPTRAP
jgi:hypothetical protein